MQVYSGKGHSSSADVFRQRNTGHIGKHSLEVIGRTAGDTAKLLIIYFIRQMFFHITNCLV